MKIFLRLFILALIGIIFYSFFFGALLFLNPIKIEYERVKGPRSIVYMRDITTLEPFYYEVETHMAQAEEFTGLKFSRNPTIIVSQDSEEFARFVPWIQNSKSLGGVSLQAGNVIYINSELIKKQKYNEREFFRHELIHNLISQNSILLNNLVIDKQQWFSEGIATYFGGPHYLSDLEFVQQYDEKDPDFDAVSANIFINLPDDPKFNYTLYKLFIKYLIENYGIETFREFTYKYLDSPSNFRIVFNEVYKKKMILVVEDFMKDYKGLSR